MSPPVGDMASEPAPPLLGSPTLGLFVSKASAPTLAPPAVGGARPAPASSGAPSPAPPLVRPEAGSVELPPTIGGGGTILLLLASRVARGVATLRPAPDGAGGGGTTLGVPRVGAEEEEGDRLSGPPDIAVEGGGATTFAPRVEPRPLRAPCGLPPAVFAPIVRRQRDGTRGKCAVDSATGIVRMKGWRRGYNFGGPKDLAHQAAHERSACGLRGRRGHNRVRRIWKVLHAGQAARVLGDIA